MAAWRRSWEPRRGGRARRGLDASVQGRPGPDLGAADSFHPKRAPEDGGRGACPASSAARVNDRVEAPSAVTKGEDCLSRAGAPATGPATLAAPHPGPGRAVRRPPHHPFPAVSTPRPPLRSGRPRVFPRGPPRPRVLPHARVRAGAHRALRTFPEGHASRNTSSPENPVLAAQAEKVARTCRRVNHTRCAHGPGSHALRLRAAREIPSRWTVPDALHAGSCWER